MPVRAVSMMARMFIAPADLGTPGRQGRDRVRARTQPALTCEEPAAVRGSRSAGNRGPRQQDSL